MRKHLQVTAQALEVDMEHPQAADSPDIAAQHLLHRLLDVPDLLGRLPQNASDVLVGGKLLRRLVWQAKNRRSQQMGTNRMKQKALPTFSLAREKGQQAILR